MQISFMRVYNYLNQRLRIIGEQNGELFKDISKTNKQKNIKRLIFVTQFKIEF